jgi:hypothetical protein
MELKVKKRKGNDSLNTSDIKTHSNNMEEIGAICMTTQENETNNIFIGTDDSDIYQVYAHQSNDSTETIVETYKKHTGSVYSIAMHPGDYHKSSNSNVNRNLI